MNLPATIVEPGQVAHIPLDLIDPDPDQPRKDFDPQALQDLADDIALRGVEQPITVRPVDGGRYVIKLGERRYRASRLAGRDTIPAIVSAEASAQEPLDRLLDQVKENCLRRDLTAVEWGHFFRRLREEFNLQVKEIPAMLEARGLKRISRSYVSQHMRLTELPEWAVGMINRGEIPPSYGKALAIACQSPLVEAAVRARLERPDGDYMRIESEQQLEFMVLRTYEKLHPCADGVCSEWDQKQPLYDTSPAEIRAALDVREIKIGGETLPVIFNLEEHERRQEEARAQGRRPKGVVCSHQHQDADDGAGASTKPEKSAAALPDDAKIELYLDDWLRRHIWTTVFEEPAESCQLTVATLRTRLLRWAALGAPAEDPTLFRGLNAFRDRGVTPYMGGDCRLGVAERLQIVSLRDVLADIVPLSTIEEQLAEALVMHMERASLMDLVRWLEIDLLKAYVLDEAYLDLHKKTGIAKLVKDARGLESSPEWKACQKLGQMRAFCLERAEAFAVPKQLAKVWKKRVKAYRLQGSDKAAAPAEASSDVAS